MGKRRENEVGKRRENEVGMKNWVKIRRLLGEGRNFK